ncbi:Receptor-like protein kinase THESEUS 1 [Camellia lanceoleosa]|uniref:Receptor-like protein kinase THESEUS 1 n=1 Tax=Camellia lanceoleosa TaxID=1840588 RepID=A0ACC0FQF6_9ERIC|nr:Receptor-like protein kinase THESEUS 1 [Camellia lanceoleosa]
MRARTVPTPPSAPPPSQTSEPTGSATPDCSVIADQAQWGQCWTLVTMHKVYLPWRGSHFTIIEDGSNALFMISRQRVWLLRRSGDDELVLQVLQRLPDHRPDVYSFGVVLLEVLSVKSVMNPIAEGEDVNLVEWVSSHLHNGTADQIVDTSKVEVLNNMDFHITTMGTGNNSDTTLGIEFSEIVMPLGH